MSRRLSVVFVLLIVLSAFAPGTALLAKDVPTPDATPDDISPKFILYDPESDSRGNYKEVELKPGVPQERQVVVENTGNVPLTLRIQPVNVGVGTNGGLVTLDETAKPEGTTTWLEMPETVIDLKPGENTLVSFTVTIPEGTEPGQYIAAIVGRTVDAIDLPGQSGLSYTIGYAVSMRFIVAGPEVREFKLGDPEIESNLDRTVLHIPFENTGNYLVAPSGTIAMFDTNGKQVLSADIEMKNVYGGFSTEILLPLPPQLTPGDYTVNVNMMDADYGAQANLEKMAVTMPVPADPTGISIADISIEPNASPIVFANVALTIQNGGSQIAAADVLLEVYHNDTLVESFPLATKQVLLNGENTLSARYLPADIWKPGTYTFQVVVQSVEPGGGLSVELLRQEVETRIVVP